MEKVKITNTNTGKTVSADVLNRSDKSLRVVLQGTMITLNLTRSDLRRPYIGHMNGMEFSSAG